MPVPALGLILDSPGHVELREFAVEDPSTGEARVRVAGCGVCHTDVSFYSGAVRTRHPLPLVLGHEIAGIVEAAPPPFEHLIGQSVVVPAVMPCGKCDLCRAGRENACQSQIMPGNHVHGGFATRVVVPAAQLVPVTDLGRHTLAELSVIADAVTTPYQALQRAGVAHGDLVIVIGAGGIGTYAVQIARALGAEVAAIDIDADKLRRLDPYGVRWTFDARSIDSGTVRKALLAQSGVSTARWRILEMSGTAAGQEFAWGLLVPAATLGVIGFTMDKPSIRLSTLMALDATAFGSWGCSPRWYPAVLDLVVSGKVQLKPFVEVHDLDEGPALLAAMTGSHHGSGRRAILVPE